MNNKAWAFLGTLFVTIISVVLAYYLNLNKPDVRYTLSEEIPLSFSSVSDAEIENVQQLEIRNVGSAGAGKIVVKISGSITNYKVVKYISSDKVEVFLDEQPVEFVYPLLPPQADFKIIFTSSDVVNLSDVNISHSTGQAVDALSISNRSGSYLFWGIYLLLIGVYIIGFAIFGINSSIDIWKSETRRKRIDQALVSSQPWYVSHSKWVIAHLGAIKVMLREEYVPQGKVAYCVAYGFLNEEKPNHFSDYDWKELNVLAVNRLKDHLSNSIDTYSESSILSVIQIIKPEKFPSDDWEVIQLKAHEVFVKRNKEKIYGKEQMVELLHRKKPEAISDTAWQDLKSYCQKCYFDELIHEINFRGNPKAVLNDNDLEILSTQQKTKLEETVYKIFKVDDYKAVLEALLIKNEIRTEKPSTLEDWEWRRIKDFEARIAQTKEIEIRKQELETKERELKQELATKERELKQELATKERELEQELETKERALKQELAAKRHELEQMQLESANEQETYLELKSKVLKQLDFINNMLGDPSTITRVESYDDTFSSGNWKNLQKIAELFDSRKAS